MKMLTIGLIRKVLNALPSNERANRSILRRIGHDVSLDAGKIPQGFGDAIHLTSEQPASVVTPTLFLWGEDYGFGGPDQAEAISGLLPSSELELRSASGHLPWLDDPRRVAQAGGAFLRFDGRVQQVAWEASQRGAGS